MAPNASADRTTRRLLNAIIAVTLLWFLIRMTWVESREGGLPFQSANDRSRWCTIRALVDHGTYAIDDVIRIRGWDTIDKVAHPGSDGQMHYYSSKPTLLPTLLAIPYWLVKHATGWTLESHPLLVGRLMVGLVHGLLLLALFIPLRNLLLQYAPNRETAILVMLVATWGTYLTSFAVTWNNHLVAAAAVMVSAAGYLRIERELDRGEEGAQTRSPPGQLPGTLIITGLSAAFAVANELPALSYFILLVSALLWRHPRPTVQWLLPAALFVGLLAVGTNYYAHQSLTPPYMHRTDGGDWSSGNWYVYPGSYWSSDARSAIDQGERSRWVYAFHVLLGHHGIITLTPIWLFLFMAMGGLPPQRERRWLVAIAAAATVICLVFYIGLRPQHDRNYGGRSVAFRWSLWLVPLWWIVLIDPVARALRSRPGRVIAWLLLVASIASASYGWLLPWKHPWLYRIAVGE